jgi:hypothetical protein
MKGLLIGLGGALIAAVVTGTGGSRVSGPAFYVDGVIYRTVGTSTTPRVLAPAHSFDIIYDLGGVQLNVAEAAPGDTDYNAAAGKSMRSSSATTSPE